MPTDSIPSPPMTDAEIADLERLEKAATPGPWIVENGSGDWHFPFWARIWSREIPADDVSESKLEDAQIAELRRGKILCFNNDANRRKCGSLCADAALIAAARNALPRLLAEVRASRRAGKAPCSVE